MYLYCPFESKIEVVQHKRKCNCENKHKHRMSNILTAPGAETKSEITICPKNWTCKIALDLNVYLRLEIHIEKPGSVNRLRKQTQFEIRALTKPTSDNGYSRFGKMTFPVFDFSITYEDWVFEASPTLFLFTFSTGILGLDLNNVETRHWTWSNVSFV